MPMRGHTAFAWSAGRCLTLPLQDRNLCRSMIVFYSLYRFVYRPRTAPVQVRRRSVNFYCIGIDIEMFQILWQAMTCLKAPAYCSVCQDLLCMLETAQFYHVLTNKTVKLGRSNTCRIYCLHKPVQQK